MTDELKSLIEDAAKLLGIRYHASTGTVLYDVTGRVLFNPLDPERGDLMKVADAAELAVDHEVGAVTCPMQVADAMWFQFSRNNYKSLALAVLRAASAVYRAMNGNET